MLKKKQQNKQQNKHKPLIFASAHIYPRMRDILNEGGSVITLPPHSSVYDAINNHPDIVMQVIHGELYIDSNVYNDIDEDSKRRMEQYGRIHLLEPLLSKRYPHTVWYNGKMTEYGYLHHKAYTHPAIIEVLKAYDVKRIHTNQGYTGCSLLYMGAGKGITADSHIYNVLQAKGADLLKINPGYIELEGMTYGFIGGCCGVYERKIYVHGSFDTHPQGEQMRRYINETGYDLVEIDNEPLRDIGSMLFW